MDPKLLIKNPKIKSRVMDSMTFILLSVIYCLFRIMRKYIQYINIFLKPLKILRTKTKVDVREISVGIYLLND